MSLKNKLIILIIILLSFCVVLGEVGLSVSKKITDNYSEIATQNMPSQVALLEALAHMRSVRIYLAMLAIPNLSDTEMQKLKERIKEELEKYNHQAERYSSLKLSEKEQKLYKSVKDQMDLLKSDFTKALELHGKSNGKEGNYIQEMRHLIAGDVMNHGKSFREELTKLLDEQTDESVEQVTLATNAGDQGKKYIYGGIFTAVLFGGLIGFFILKNIMADQIATAKLMEEAVRSYNMVEKSTVSTMMSSLDGHLIYLNEIAKKTLTRLEMSLPEKVENLVGKNFDFLHTNPNEKSLPIRTLVTLGSEKLDVLISGIYNKEGLYIGPMITFEVVTAKNILINNLTTAAYDLANAATNVLSISSNLSAAAEETSAQANTASVASEEVNSGVQTVASSMDEMVTAIKEITKTTNEASSMTNEAMALAKNANVIVNKLGDSSMDIGNVIKVISSIAQQTNLLALNATIEAARAGEAGKGFAVVANEVKELANQTAKATSEITKKIETIQTDSKSAVNAIAEISIAIEKVNGFTGDIAASVEEQAATTHEVTRIVSEAAQGVKQINENISQVSVAASNTGKDAGSANIAAGGVGDIAQLLKKYVNELNA
jgi:methyl-accepting chemotaxis protein